MQVGKVNIWVYQMNEIDKHHVSLGLFLNGKMVEFHKHVNKVIANNIINSKQTLNKTGEDYEEIP